MITPSLETQLTENMAKSKGRVCSWAALIFCLFVVMPPLLVRLGVNSSITSMEGYALLSSQETWIRQHQGENKAWLVPSLMGGVRIEKPPLIVWLDMLAWGNLDPDTASPETIVWRGRFISVLLGLAVLAGTFWIGHQLGGLRLASAATLVTGTGYLFLRQARMASYDIQMAGWVTLAIGAALWSLGSWEASQASRRKRFLGLLLAGVFLWAAVMTKGPLAIVHFTVPVLIVIFLAPAPRAGGIAGLLLALATGLILAAPWFLYVLRNVAGALQIMAFEYQADYHKRIEFWYYLQVVPLIFPWSICMIGSLSLPFGIRDLQARRRALFPWLWFVIMIIGFSIPNAKSPRYLAPLLPAIGLMTAQFWLRERETEGRPARWLKFLGRMHWAVLLIISGSFPFYVLFEEKLKRIGMIKELLFSRTNLMMAVLFALLLIALSVAGAWAYARGKSSAALLLTAGWMVIATTFGFDVYFRLPHLLFQHRSEAENVSAMIGKEHVVYLVANPDLDQPPSREFLFYSRRTVPPISPDELKQKLRRGESCYVIIRTDPANEKFMEELGFNSVFEFRDGRISSRRLYQSPASKAEH
jgi:hypothetical protein